MKGFFLKNNLNQPLQFVFIFFNEGKANGVQGKVIFFGLVLFIYTNRPV